MNLDKNLITGSLVLILIAVLMLFVPGLDLSRLEDGGLSLRDLLVMGASVVIMILTGTVRFRWPGAYTSAQGVIDRTRVFEMDLGKVLLNGSIVVIIGVILINFVPGLDTSVLQDGDLTVRDLWILAGSFLTAIGNGLIRFIQSRS